jgi:membrane protease YdiL (CAAX protease family)
MIVTGFVCISYSFASIIITAPALFQLDLINDITRDFSIGFYLKALIVAPIVEEYLFRGIILNGFLNRYSPAKAIIITTILFPLMHLNPMQYLVTFLLGMLLGWYYYKTRSLLTCIIVHAFSNLIGLTILKYFVDRLQGQFIGSGTKVIQIDNTGLFIFLSLSLIIVGFFYLFKSVILEPSDKHLNT